MRTCLGCYRRFPKSGLFRFTLGREGPVAGQGAGRGYYICRNDGCFEKALGRRSLSRLLRRAVGAEEVEGFRRALRETGGPGTGGERSWRERESTR